MKRYILFAHSSCYPSGGWRDVVNFHDDLDAAISEGREECRRINEHDTLYHVVCLRTGTVVADGLFYYRKAAHENRNDTSPAE